MNLQSDVKSNNKNKKIDDNSTVAKGKKYEMQVANYLRKKGFQIRIQNFRCPMGEIDIIAEKEKNIYFVEVKGQARDMQAEMKINKAKRKRIEMTSIEYIRQNQLWSYGIHYDVAIVTNGRIKYYANAFEGKDIWL